MKGKKLKPLYNTGWCFAVVNSRLAEIHFGKDGIWAHCYIARKDFNKREQKMIAADTKRCQFTYRKGYYLDKKLGIKRKIGEPPFEEGMSKEKWMPIDTLWAKLRKK